MENLRDAMQNVAMQSVRGTKDWRDTMLNELNAADTPEIVAVREVLEHDVHFLRERGKLYGDSWRKRGGIGAFMMLARKWDRLENALMRENITYDVFTSIQEGHPTVLADLRDLRRYLALVEAHVRNTTVGGPPPFDDPNNP